MKRVCICLVLFSFAFVVHSWAASRQDVELTAVVADSPCSMLIYPEDISMGTLAPSTRAFRFNTTAIRLNFSPCYPSWRILVYTDQEDSMGQPIEGLKAEGVDFAMPLKMWQANFGPSSDDPDYSYPLNGNIDRFWKGHDGDGDGSFTNNLGSPWEAWEEGQDFMSVFPWILDKDNDPMALASSWYQDSPPLEFFIYTDAWGAMPTNYRSTITLDMVFY